MTATGAVNVGPGFGAYAKSFMNMPHGTQYVNGWHNTDMRGQIKSVFQDKLVQAKALGPESGGAGTAGFALVPVYVDPRIVDLSRKFTPLREMIPRVTNLGTTADYNEITAKGGAITALPDADFDDQDDTYNRQSKAIKYLYAKGRVLGPAQAAIPGYLLDQFSATGAGLTGQPFSDANALNAMQLAVLGRARALMEKEEDLIINGSIASDATEFDGIVQQQGTTNQVDLAAAALTWDDVERAVRLAYDDSGRPKIAVASSSVVEDLRKIMIDTFNYRPVDMTNGELPFGVAPVLVLQTMVGPIPVIPSQYLSNVSGSKQIFFLDTDFIEMRVLQDMTFEPLAQTNDSKPFLLKMYECLLLRAPQFNSFIDNIQ